MLTASIIRTMEAVRTSGTSANFYEIALRNMSEDSHLRIRRRRTWNLIAYYIQRRSEISAWAQTKAGYWEKRVRAHTWAFSVRSGNKICARNIAEIFSFHGFIWVWNVDWESLTLFALVWTQLKRKGCWGGYLDLRERKPGAQISHPKTGYPDWGFSCYSSVPPGICLNSPFN
jgi:hypothetical protein